MLGGVGIAYIWKNLEWKTVKNYKKTKEINA